MALPNEPPANTQVVSLVSQILEEQKKQSVALQRIQQAMGDLAGKAAEVAVTLKKIQKTPTEPRTDHTDKGKWPGSSALRPDLMAKFDVLL